MIGGGWVIEVEIKVSWIDDFLDFVFIGNSHHVLQTQTQKQIYISDMNFWAQSKTFQNFSNSNKISDFS